MSIETDLFADLGPLVANRVYPVQFPQPPSTPVWPAIRYTFVSLDSATSICGDQGDLGSVQRVQLDIVANTYTAVRALRLQVMATMQLFEPPAIVEANRENYDAETKTFRSSLDYMIYSSKVVA